MIKQRLVRGFNDKIFFAQSTGQEDRVYSLEFHPSKPRQLTRQPIYTLNGSKLVLLTTDFSNCQNDAIRKVRQSLFLLDDKQTVKRLVSNDGAQYTVTDEFDLSHHNIKQQMNLLKKTDWSQAFISNRAITFLDRTYSFNSELSYRV